MKVQFAWQSTVVSSFSSTHKLPLTSLRRVIMLYIDCEVQGVKLKAFVDSGAQQTIMSEAMPT